MCPFRRGTRIGPIPGWTVSLEPYLLDTNIVSELARKSPNRDVIAFIAQQSRLHVSVILFHELTYGLETASAEQKPRLTIFIAGLRERFGKEAIPVDLAIAETAGRLRAFEKANGRVLTVADSLMAATAVIRDLALVTRNIKDFETLGLKLVNPFTA
jgi:predicted nucleic acid-binding protein